MAESKKSAMAKPDLYVVARFLEKLMVKKGGWKKTQLQMAVGLNYNVYSKYLDWLEDKKLILMLHASDEGQLVTLTPKGHELYIILLKLLEEVMGQTP